MDFEKRISDYGMTLEQYEASFAEITAKVQGNSDKDWTEIIDQYSIPLSRNTLRNACSNVYGSVFVKEYFDEKRRKEMEVNSEPTTDEPAPLSLPRYKEQTDVNKDGSFTSDRLIEINEENLKILNFYLTHMVMIHLNGNLSLQETLFGIRVENLVLKICMQAKSM